MEHSSVTTDMVMEAGIAAALVANTTVTPFHLSSILDQNEMGTELKIFSLDNSELFGTHGPSDDESESVSGLVTASTDLKDRFSKEERIAKRNRNDTTELAAAEAISVMEDNLAEMREVTIGGVTMTGQEIQEIMEVLDDPAKTERASQDYAARNDVSIEQARSEIDWFNNVMVLVEKQSNGTITASEQARLDEMTQEPGFDGRFQKAKDSLENVANDADISMANDARLLATGDAEQVIEAATTGSIELQDAVAAQIDDREVWQEARSAQGYAEREIDDLASRGLNNGGDELSALFGDVAQDSQLTAVAEQSQEVAPINSSPAPLLG